MGCRVFVAKGVRIGGLVGLCGIADGVDCLFNVPRDCNRISLVAFCGIPHTSHSVPRVTL